MPLLNAFSRLPRIRIPIAIGIDRFSLCPWQLDAHTCYLILDTCYLLLTTYYLLFTWLVLSRHTLLKIHRALNCPMMPDAATQCIPKYRTAKRTASHWLRGHSLTIPYWLVASHFHDKIPDAAFAETEWTTTIFRHRVFCLREQTSQPISGKMHFFRANLSANLEAGRCEIRGSR